MGESRTTPDERIECYRCAVKCRHISWISDPYLILNSRTATWHIEAEAGNGKTECGADATADHWRWPACAVERKTL